MRNFLFCIFCLFDDHLSSHHSALDDFDLCSVVIVGSHCLLKLGFSDVIDRGHCHSPRLVVQELFRSYVAPFLVIPEFVVNVVEDVVLEVVWVYGDTFAVVISVVVVDSHHLSSLVYRAKKHPRNIAHHPRMKRR